MLVGLLQDDVIVDAAQTDATDRSPPASKTGARSNPAPTGATEREVFGEHERMAIVAQRTGGKPLFS